MPENLTLLYKRIRKRKERIKINKQIETKGK